MGDKCNYTVFANERRKNKTFGKDVTMETGPKRCYVSGFEGGRGGWEPRNTGDF